MVLDPPYESSSGPEARTLTAPYDAELFGHWWFEGVAWLEEVFRLVDGAETPPFETVRLGDRLDAAPRAESVTLEEGSWGYGGRHDVWLNDRTRAWWERAYRAEDRMTGLAAGLGRSPGQVILTEVVRQAARELLLLQGSDWHFLMTTGHAADYAEARLALHLRNFGNLADAAEGMMAGREPDAKELAELERLKERDFVFPDLDPSWWT